MTTDTAETYPWDRTEPFVPTAHVSLIVVAETPLSVFAHHTDGGAPVTGLAVGDLSLHFGLHSDEDTLVVMDRILLELTSLRAKIEARLAADLASA